MRLAFICHPYHRGGVTRWMVDAAAESRRRGHDVWFVVPRPRRPFENGANRPTVADLVESVASGLQPKRVEPVVGPEFELGTSAYRASVYARAALEEIPPGAPVIVSDDAAAWAAGAMLAGRNPFVGVLHADDTWYYELAAQHRDSVSALVAVSQRIAHRAREMPGLTVPVWAVPCGVPIPPDMGEGLEPTDEARLLWIGRIDERQKRVSDLPAIATALARAGVRFRLEIVGDGYDVPLIRAGLSSDVGRFVHFRGWSSADVVHSLLREADLLLLPSNFEGMPVVAMEALARGCGVIASSASGLEEYRERPVTRACLWIHEVGDVAAATEAVQAALRIERRVRRACARQFARDEFAIGKCMERYEDCLSGLRPRPQRTVPAQGSWFVTRVLSHSVAAVRKGRRWLNTI